MPIEDMAPLPGGDELLIVNLPLGKTIFVAGLKAEEVEYALGSDGRFESCNKNEARTLAQVPDDAYALITLRSLTPNDSIRLRRDANERGIMVIGSDGWSADDLRSWREKAKIQDVTADDAANEIVQKKTLGDERLWTRAVRARGNMLDQRHPTYYQFLTAKDQTTVHAPTLPRPILVIVGKDFKLPTERGWLRNHAMVRFWTPDIALTVRQFPVGTRFVVYNPDALEPQKVTMLLATVQATEKCEAIEAFDDEEVVEVLYNLVRFGSRSVPAREVESLGLNSNEPDEELPLEETYERPNLGTEEEDAAMNPNPTVERALNIRLPVGQKMLVAAPDIKHLEHKLGKLTRNGYPVCWELWDMAMISRAGNAPDQVSLHNVACLVLQQNLRPAYQSTVRSVVRIHSITQVIENATHEQILVAAEAVLRSWQEADNKAPVPASDAPDVDPEIETDPAPTHHEASTTEQAAPQGEIYMYMNDPPKSLRIPAGKRVYVIGINPQAPAEALADEDHFCKLPGSAAAKLLNGLPDDFGAGILTAAVEEPVRSQFGKLCAGKEKLCIAVTNWRLADVLTYIENTAIAWGNEPTPAAKRLETPTDTSTEASSEVVEVPPATPDTSEKGAGFEGLQVPPEAFEPRQPARDSEGQILVTPPEDFIQQTAAFQLGQLGAFSTSGSAPAGEVTLPSSDSPIQRFVYERGMSIARFVAANYQLAEEISGNDGWAGAVLAYAAECVGLPRDQVGGGVSTYRKKHNIPTPEKLRKGLSLELKSAIDQRLPFGVPRHIGGAIDGGPVKSWRQLLGPDDRIEEVDLGFLEPVTIIERKLSGLVLASDQLQNELSQLVKVAADATVKAEEVKAKYNEAVRQNRELRQENTELAAQNRQLREQLEALEAVQQALAALDAARQKVKV